MRILALVPGGIGDQLLFFPTLETLQQSFPTAAIDVVVEPRALAAYRLCPVTATPRPFDFKARNSLADWANLLGTLREQEYAIALSLGRNANIGLFLWLAGIPQRVGYGDSLFLTDRVPYNGHQYAAHAYHDLVKGLRLKTPPPKMRIAVAKTDLDWANRERMALGITGGYIALHAGASLLSQIKGIDKIYPATQWAEVLKGLQEKAPELPILLLKGPEDGAIAAALAATVPTLKTLSPPDTGKLAALIAGSNLFLCTDSAPMHIGVAVEANLLALFGATDPAKLLPPQPNFKFVQAPAGQPLAALSPNTILAQLWD
ncbi:MAG: glycosyltransferase family 9 protein [Oscillatoriales cyanobacterium SM2_1_8]|nr:glycosyltransferase family 9 protein [Oscillatoriales cyanobacterium SM2_1_8]